MKPCAFVYDCIERVSPGDIPGDSRDALIVGSGNHVKTGTPVVLLGMRLGDVALRVAIASSENATAMLRTLERAIAQAWPPPGLLSPAQCRCDGCGSEAVSGDVFCPAHRESYAAELLGEGGGL